ncbi:DNA methyltransferase [uncultured Thiodictyon sp.]|uniref:DNA methyltransferase n=1 Tax=uncultured Thiodictyon sp. TaxID=1846217 RepID=UPI0025F6734A|nr:DNA methyltransferase [uncultured Thiodictyon sp.]
MNPPEPVIRDFRNIQCRDAVLDYDCMEWVTDEAGRPVTRWDGRTFKPHPVTGEAVPDESAQVPQERYVNPRRAAWPAADFVVGNPPFIGNKRMRQALGDGYVEALRGAWPDVPGSADYVMYWWHQAGELAGTRHLRRFGLITTNSLRQTFNRQVIERHLKAENPISLLFVIPDHPWVDAAEGAAVRIGMTVGEAGVREGQLFTVTHEQEGAGEGVQVALALQEGVVHADLTTGAKAGGTTRLLSNHGLCFQGMNLVGKGFRVTLEEVRALGYDPVALPDVIKPHRNARDMMQNGEDIFVIDFFGCLAEEARATHPALYQRLLDRVKPERDQNRDAQRRRDWWLFGRSNAALRACWKGLSRIILTPETSKHRVFAFQQLPFCPDHKLYAICSDDAYILGILSARTHAIWALRAGGRLGFGNDPTWTNTTCFLLFPFPAPTEPQKAHVRQLAEALDAHRKARQALHSGLTMTGMYNVLEQLRRGEPLGPKERQVHEQGLVSVLRQLHDELDAAVLAAYGWADLTGALLAGSAARTLPRSLPDPAPAVAVAPVGSAARTLPTSMPDPETTANPGPVGSAARTFPPSTLDADTAVGAGAVRTADPTADRVEALILERLVALNAERSAEERRGLIRWLRPALQHPGGQADDGAVQTEAPLGLAAPTASGPKPDWPKTLPEQFQALRAALAARPGPGSAADLAQGFTRAPRARVAELLETLASLGHARRLEDGRYLPG